MYCIETPEIYEFAGSIDLSPEKGFLLCASMVAAFILYLYGPASRSAAGKMDARCSQWVFSQSCFAQVQHLWPAEYVPYLPWW